MKILYVLNSGKPGGVEQHVLDLINSMVSLNHSVYVWCLEGEIVSWYESAGAKVFTNHKIKLDICLSYILSLASFISKNKIEVVHAHELKAGVNALFACVLSGVKVRITHIHTPMSEWQVKGFIKKIITKLQIKMYSLLVNLFSSSEISLTESRKKVKIDEGILERKLTVIPNALDTKKFDLSSLNFEKYRQEIRAKYSIPEDVFVFGNIGRHTEEKGIDILINAFSQLYKKSQNKNLFLLLAGGGKLEEYHKKLAQDLDIAEKVIITGIFADEDKIKLYAALDTFIFPSRAEGFGIVLMEAMFLGLPVISSDLEVLKEVGGNTISYFKKENFQDLSDKMAQLLNQKKSYNMAAHIRVEQDYTLEKFKDSYQTLYRKFIGASNL